MIERPQRGIPKPTGSVVAAVLIIVIGLICLIASQSVLGLPEAVTSQGERIKALYGATLAICLIVYVLVTGGIIWALIRYRRRSADEMPQQIHGSSFLEATWTVIPVIILVGLFIPALLLVIDLKTPPDADEADLTVQAVGHQWWWEFIYPDSGIRIQQLPPNYEDLTPPVLVVPTDKTVRVIVSSTDVVHSFSAPNLLYKIQAIPGNLNEMHFKVEKAGTYSGQCYQFCGLRHSDMLFVLDAREEADYQRWLQDTRRAQGLTDQGNEATAGTLQPATANTSE